MIYPKCSEPTRASFVRFMTSLTGGSKSKKSLFRQNAARGCFALWGTYFSAYLHGICVPPAPPHLVFPLREMWTHWGEIP